MPEGYCTVDDVRRVLQETIADFDSGAWGADNNQVVVDAIVSQTQWLRDATDRHWYEPGGLEEDDQSIIPTEAKTRSAEEQDIPSTPHAGPSQMQVAASRQERYPLRNNDPFTRIRLDKHYAGSLTAIEVKDASGTYTDWVAADGYDEGQDYALYVEPGSTSSPSFVDLRARRLPRLDNYDNAVRVSYEYGAEGLSRTARRATAMKAAAQLLAPDDEASLGIPENANLQTVETKVQALERQAEELLEAFD